MGKLSKPKKTKIPKLTEAQYAAYLSSLKDGVESAPICAQSMVGQTKEDKEKAK